MPFSQRETLVSLELQFAYANMRKLSGNHSALLLARFHPSTQNPDASQCQIWVQLGMRHPLIICVKVPQDQVELIGFCN